VRGCTSREITRGRTIDEIRENEGALQRGIEDMQPSIESGLRAIDAAFLDRAVPDCLAWHRLFGLNPNEILPECFHHRYASVFILDPLPYQENGARFEDASIVGYLDEWHARDYGALGYNVVRVPVLAPEERLAFALESLSEQGLI
jgi:predicted ATPase